MLVMKEMSSDMTDREILCYLLNPPNNPREELLFLSNKKLLTTCSFADK